MKRLANQNHLIDLVGRANAREWLSIFEEAGAYPPEILSWDAQRLAAIGIHDPDVQSRLLAVFREDATHGRRNTDAVGAGQLGRLPAYDPAGRGVTVVDVDMPFGRIVAFMVKWALAAIPAFIILWCIFAGLAALFGGALAAAF